MLALSWASNFSMAGTGPIPIKRGETPAVLALSMRAKGVKLNSFIAFSLASNKAAAPSFTPDALPAVTVPFLRKGVGSCANFSSEVWRGCSSWSTIIVSALRVLISIGIISCLKRPASMALAARCCERRANSSWSWREMLKLSATFSAVSGMESIP